MTVYFAEVFDVASGLMAKQISRKFTDEDFGGAPNLDQKIEIFEDRVLGWQIEIAENVLRCCRHGAFGALSIVFSYFEMIMQYQAGTSSDGKSTEFLKDGLEDVFPKEFKGGGRGKIANLVRNGLYHSTFTKKGVLLDGDYRKSIAINAGVVEINPHNLVRDIRAHFETYIAGLKNGTNCTTNFERMYDKAVNP